MKHPKFIRGVLALPFLAFGSVALAQGAQQPGGPSGYSPSESEPQTQPQPRTQTQSERMRQQDSLSGSQAGRTGTSPSGQAQQGSQRSQQQPGMQQGQQTPQSRQGQQAQQGQQSPQARQGQQGQARQQQPGMQQGQGGEGSARFQDLDRNGDGEITRNELRQGSANIVATWDFNQDGKVTQLEVSRAIYKRFDSNGDESIDEQEYEAAKGKWIPERATATYAEWDGNRDGKLDYFEFAEGLQTAEVSRGFDQNRDMEVTERELANGLFSSLDRDQNGRLDAEEWPLS